MASTRALVTGRYLNKSTYVLYNQDGSVFQTIKEGEGFCIDNQMKQWIPVLVARKNGRGTILMCRKFRNNGEILEEFPLIHNKVGLWALTSGAARNGVFHNYKKPQTGLEVQLSSMGVPARVLSQVNSIDVTLELGGQLCHHCTHNWGFVCKTDCKVEALTEPNYASEDEFNQYHHGCMISTYQAHIYGGTFLIYWNVDTYMNGCRHQEVQKVLVTPHADENNVIEALKSISEGGN